MMEMLQKMTPALRPIPEGTRMTDWRICLATWFGAGRLRPAPGTIGSLAAVPFGFIIAHQGGVIGLAMAALALLCIGTVAAQYYGEKSGQVDDNSIVVDEVVGLWIAAIPAGNNLDLWLTAFILFRIFDIYKPWPASWFDENSRRGIDVMMDDVVAGIYALFGTAALAAAYL